MSKRALPDRNVRRRLGLLAAAFVGMAICGCGGPDVEVVAPAREFIRESFTEPARTKLARVYPITMPVAGRIGRIDIDPGDPVKSGQELVKFDRTPLEKSVEAATAAVDTLKAEIEVKDNNRLELTAIKETRATIQASEEALQASKQQVAAEKARHDRAVKELKRMTALITGQAIPQSKMDDVTLLAETALLELRRQEFNEAAFNALLVAIRLGPVYVEQYLGRKTLEKKVLVHRLEEAQAKLAETRHRLSQARITSPIDGVTLKRYEQGPGFLQSGAPLLLLGNLDDLEVVAEVITQDALRLKPGGKVILEPADGAKPIPGTVKKIEPAGFTKLSSLGVEQQRVNVLVKIEGPHDSLGVGYRVQARFITGSNPNALIVPRFSVMQNEDRSFYVFKVADDELKRQSVSIGLRSDLKLEIVKGLSEKDLIVARPDAAMREGMSVTPMNTSGPGG